MKKNTGNLDRILRVVVGLAVIAGGWFAGSWFGLIGLVPLGTAAIGYCPLYSIFGLNTCSSAK